MSTTKQAEFKKEEVWNVHGMTRRMFTLNDVF